jgi:type II secretory pathway component GspD/PulD (secretin)
MSFIQGTKTIWDGRNLAALFLTAGCIATGLATAHGEAFAQPAAAVEVRGRNPEEMKARMEAAKAAQAAGQPQPGQPGQPGQPPGAKPEDGKKPEGEGEKKDDAGTVKRPDTPPKPPDPKDLEVALDKDGRVPPFNFIGQPWTDVMQWLANLSKASLDWQDLPKGYLNLTTQRSYKLDEVHDLINQALNARGFTSIQTGEVLSVFEITKLDPAVVPQVSEEDLYNRKRFDYVKVSFELPPEMEVEKAKDDVKQVLSPNSKVFPLVTTKRLLIMDSVANLRTVSELLNQERMVKDGRIVPEKFDLKYARAESVVEILKTMVGADQPGRPQLTPEQMQQQQQMMQQMQQQGQKPPKMPNQGDAPKVYFAVNRRQNSIIVNAPPEQLKIIKQTIEYLDVPQGDNAEDVLTSGQRTLFKYNLVTMDPEQLKLTLEEIGELDPRTELRADSKSKILFAKATPADHKKIMSLKDELDGTGRTLRIFWLPRNMPAADAVAGTIMALMGNQETEESNNDNDYWGYYSYRRRNDDDKPKKGFRVEADIENNRVLAWANDAEHEQIKQFLAELGKSSPASESRNTVRALEIGDPEATTRLLEQLRKSWPELIIDDQRPKTETPAPAEEKKPDAKPASQTKDRAASSQPSASRRDAATVGESLRSTTRRGEDSHGTKTPFQLVQLSTDTPPANTLDAEAALADEAITEAPSEPATNDEPPAESESPADEPKSETESSAAETPARPPINVTVTPDGRVILQSNDTMALDRLEEFIGEAAPPTQRYKIFRIQHADDYLIWRNLEEYYVDEIKGDTQQVWDWWDYDMRDVDSGKGNMLSKRPPLRFVWDPDTRSILVANASARQLAEVESLIKAWDQPAPDDETSERITRPIKIKYSRASTIVASVKEVFRDLLSSKDKEFSKDQNAKSGSSSSGFTILRFGPSNSNTNSNKQTPVKVGFQGALSLGADDVSNIVLVSAEKQVFALVEAMINELDEEAAPKTTVQVHRVNGKISAEALQKALDQAVGTAWLGNRPEPTGQNAQAEQKPEGDQNRDGDRGNRGDRNRNRDND